MMLEVLGHQVVPASHGQEALDLLAEDSQPPADVAILDLSIRGGLSGESIAARFRDQSPDTKLVVASGHETDPIMCDCQSFGFDAALAKPFTLNDLRQLLDNLQAGG